MRIHIVTSEYSGVTSYSGGIGTQYANLAPALAAQGDEVHVVTLTNNQPEVTERNGVRVVRVHVPRAPWLIPAQWPLAADRALRRLPVPDAVVAAEFSAGAAAYSLRRGRAPLVTHLHSSLLQIMKTSRWSLRRRLLPQSLVQRGLERVQAQRSDALLSPSTQLLEWAQRLWPVRELPAAVVPNTVDVHELRRLAEGEAPPGARLRRTARGVQRTPGAAQGCACARRRDARRLAGTSRGATRACSAPPTVSGTGSPSARTSNKWQGSTPTAC